MKQRHCIVCGGGPFARVASVQDACGDTGGHLYRGFACDAELADDDYRHRLKAMVAYHDQGNRGLRR